ncbi:aspartate kinase [Henriciella aquimarina]|uniref:aspartate kinase n=1 Tax=Henriciella aquimarina TaxID=545261 RepID=UPI0009FE036B|nr:aspartate kinase [Henriciella aquimarina]
MTHTVEKIGGTSIANTPVILDNVLIADREGDDLYNRIFVVSAYAGMTDMLLEHKKSGKPGVYALFASAENKWQWSEALTELSQAMREKNEEIFGDHPDRKVADNFVLERVEGVRNCLIDLHRLCSYGQFRLDEHLMTVREMLAALGEAHSAHNTALLLRQREINAVFVDLTGWRDEEKMTLDERIETSFKGIDFSKELPITTGYASCLEGMVKLYDRGYTEVTFSRIGALTQAKEAIIHKEFHLSSADPKLVGDDKVRKIGRTNYDVADQLSNMGMEAVHPKAAKGLRQAGIPLRVKNTFDPADAGTIITEDFMPESPRAEIVTGLQSVYAFELFEQDMVGVKGYDAEALKAMTRHKLWIVSKCSNANTITHYVSGPRQSLKRAAADIEAVFENAEVSFRKLAIVSVIGANLDVPGLTARATTALHEGGVKLLGLHKLTRETDLQTIVAEEDYDEAVKILHRALVEDNEDTADKADTDIAAAA